MSSLGDPFLRDCDSDTTLGAGDFEKGRSHLSGFLSFSGHYQSLQEE